MGLSAFLADTLGLTKIPGHLPTILWSFVTFNFIHYVVAPYFSYRWFPVFYGSRSRAGRNGWNIRIVSLFFCCAVVPLAGYSIATETPDRALNKAFGWSDTTGFVHGVATGYFLWDLVDAVINFIDLGFVVHAIACFLVYSMSYRPFVAYYGTRCLLWEMSTIFLNIHWLLDKTGRTGSKLQFINGVTLMSVFFTVRLVYGGSVSIRFFLTLVEVWEEVPTFYVIVYGGGNCLLQGLNIFWFSKMIAAMRKRFETEGDERAKLLTPNANGGAVGSTGNGVH